MFFTKLLLHCNGDDESVTIPDSSPSAHGNATVVGTAQLDTAQKKFGTASLILDGNSDYITYADHADWNFAGGDFTIDFWVRFNALPANDFHGLFGQDKVAAPASYYNLYLEDRDSQANKKGLRFYIYQSEAKQLDLNEGLADISSYSVDTWYHIAVVRSGNNWYLFKDGVQGATTIVDYTIADIPGLFYVGFFRSGGKYLNGRIDEFRVSKGIARWTANFTPPVREYGRPSQIMAII